MSTTTIVTAPGGFAAQLRERSGETWDRAIGHRFVEELFAGSVDDAVLAHYLEQDYRFFDAALSLCASCVVNADRVEPKLRFSAQLGFFAADEDGYFERALAALGSSAARAGEVPLTATSAAMIEGMRDTAHANSYIRSLIVMAVAEWLYLDWGERELADPSRPEHLGWIDLHRGADFRAWVQCIVDEIDRVGADLDEAERAEAVGLWDRFVRLELEFFDAAYSA
ncbi:transcriptional regulator, TENA/THI-4 family protein [Brevibacterium sp. 5221]|uniref:Aminopyrimidine aminohydrolase n=1 Tax=Brevibacterium rongguiense TaxID=2695267 RepID=A0A6N9H6J2_9MICO|nr:TenA family protein [Brevibacterium rongguiense]MYM19204.1 transcriptional regulator, TENA/THI-4 family protein [Brevibacterium rongguiense]